MNVNQIMTRNVKTCRSEDSLNTAAQVMWENDCGCVPVVDGDSHVVGMLTDRDICMAAYTQDKPLTALIAGSAMSKAVHSCKPEDTLAAAEAVLRAQHIRRLPVIDDSRQLVGIVSLNDLAREAARERARKGKRELAFDEVAETLAAVCQPRTAHGLASAA